MTKLTDTQAIILNAAAQRPGQNALPLPDRLRGGAAAKAVGAMLAKGLLDEVGADRHEAHPVWRETDDGQELTLIATDAGLAAIGIEPDDGSPAASGITERPDEKSAQDTPTETGAAPRRSNIRNGTKQAMMIDLLRTPEGATIEEIVTATGWLSHTVRGAIAGALKKRLGLEVTSEKIKGRGRVYRLPAA